MGCAVILSGVQAFARKSRGAIERPLALAGPHPGILASQKRMPRSLCDDVESAEVLRLGRTTRDANRATTLRMTRVNRLDSIGAYQLMTAIFNRLPTLSGSLIGEGAVCVK